jgi:hypothetical protein
VAVRAENPIAWRTVEDAIAAWVATALAIETMWQNQAEPQPAYPFATLNITGPSQIGTGDEWITNQKLDGSGTPIDEYEHEARGQREIIVSIQIDVGPPGSSEPRAHGRHLADKLLSSLQLQAFSGPLGAAGLSEIGPVGPIQDTSLTVGNLFTDRKLLEMRFGLASSVAEDIEIVERVEVTGTVSGLVDGGTFAVGPLDIDSTP